MTVTKHYLDVANIQLHYLSCGNPDATPVLLLHQVPSSAQMWTAVLHPLAERGYRVYAFDLPGYGQSDALTSSPGISELTDYAEAFAAAIGVLGYGPVFLIGHHTGSSIALQLAASYPELVRAAAVWGVPALTPGFSAELAAEAPPAYGPEFIDDVSTWWRYRIEYTAPELVSVVMPRSLQEMLQAGTHRPDGHNAVGRAGNHAAILGALTTPVLAMTGNREMLDGETRQAVKDYPDQLILGELGDAGMDIADEDPIAFVVAVDRFFNESRSGGST